MKCQRCGTIHTSLTFSFFNMDMICFNCSDLERAHPKYREAREAELEALKRGDYNFPGIGKPVDL